MFIGRKILPQALRIEAQISAASVWLLNQAQGNEFPPLYSLYLTMVFSQQPDHALLIKEVTKTFKKVGLEPPDFVVHPYGLTVEPDENTIHNYDRAIRELQKLFRPLVPYTGWIVELATSGKWEIDLIIVGGALPEDDVVSLELALVATGAQVVGVGHSRYGNTAFALSLPLKNARKRRGWLNNLPESCGIFASVQA